MNNDLIKRFDVLDINIKRNQISNELMIINELITSFESKYHLVNQTKIKNYNQVNDSELTESEMLTFFYEDIYNLQQELITLLSCIENKK